MITQDAKESIWEGDRLDRRQEAEMIEKFLVKEIDFFRKTGRNQSIVLGIDAPYGKGKTWFLERLAKQLAISHPVAQIDAWADDVGDEPLTAFMAAIDEALAPYLTVSKKLRDKLAAVKAAALPVMGKLVTGALTKALSKVAGDEIEDQLGDEIENAVRGAKDRQRLDEGVAAAAMTEAFERLGAEIDSLVDRHGAAMLAAYRQRKQSRQLFRENMRDLVAAIDQNGLGGRSPLIVVIDELDRCRPSYAIRMLEEIKHFFEVPGVVFILGLHGGQLSKSVKAVYGAEFDSEDYLRRFFTRKYELRKSNVVDLAAAVFEECGMDSKKFTYPEFELVNEYVAADINRIGLILSEWDVTPREVYPIMDGLRLFIEGWEHSEPIEPITVLSLLTQIVRGQELNFVQLKENGKLQIKGISWISNNGGNVGYSTLNEYLGNIRRISTMTFRDIRKEQRSINVSKNYILGWINEEWNRRLASSPGQIPVHSYLADYVARISELGRFVEK